MLEVPFESHRLPNPGTRARKFVTNPCAASFKTLLGGVQNIQPFCQRNQAHQLIRQCQAADSITASVATIEKPIARIQSGSVRSLIAGRLYQTETALIGGSLLTYHHTGSAGRPRPHALDISDRQRSAFALTRIGGCQPRPYWRASRAAAKGASPIVQD